MSVDFGIADEVKPSKTAQNSQNLVDLTPHVERYKKYVSENKDLFKSESALLGAIRSALREGLWKKSKVKLEFLKASRVRIKNPKPNPRRGAELIWGYRCNKCRCEFPQADVQVDHLSGENSFRKLEDLTSFTLNMICVSASDLQILCKPCHLIKTYMERYDVSEARALAVREAKNILNLNKHQEVLAELGYTVKLSKIKSEEILIKHFEDKFSKES